LVLVRKEGGNKGLKKWGAMEEDQKGKRFEGGKRFVVSKKAADAGRQGGTHAKTEGVRRGKRAS